MSSRCDGVCYALDQQGGKSNCGYAEDVMMTLCSDSHGTPHAVCYAIEGNVVDRVSAKNGKGWCEDVSPTLNTQDRHAVVYALEGNGARPSHMGKGFSCDGTMYTLNTIEQHSVCYEVYDARGNGDGKTVPTLTGDHENRITDYTAILCYNDRRHADYHIAENGIAPAVVAKFGTGGNNTPIVLMALGATDAKASITDGSIAPTMLARAGTGGGNEPIVLMKSEGQG